MIWDYIIVGAGSAGCALAYSLVRGNPAKRVLMIEAGGSDRSPFIRFPAGQPLAIARHSWLYETDPDPTREGKVEEWVRGKVLGGSSSINGTMFVRGAASDFDRWAGQLDSPDWSADRMFALFHELETSDQPGPLRGHAGRLCVRTIQHPHSLTRAFVEAAQAAGHRFNEDFNGKSQEGVALAQLSQYRGLRRSAADAFVRPIKAAANFSLLCNAEVESVLFQGDCATGVRIRTRRGQHIELARDIILCTGAIASPLLLLRSGIGDASALADHGIPVVVDLPAVGHHLQEHPLLSFTYRTKVPSYNLTQGLSQKAAIFWSYLRHREGPIANLFEGVAFLRSGPKVSEPDLQLHFLPIGYHHAPDGSFALARFPSATVHLNLSHPASRGRIGFGKDGPNGKPRIECRMLADPADVERLARGIREVRRIMTSEPMASLIDEEITPGPTIVSDADIKAYIKANTGIAYHPSGTCRMGRGRDSVVGPDMRVHSTRNLWVADASIMPDLISGNTNAVCMAIGLKLGKQLAARGNERFDA